MKKEQMMKRAGLFLAAAMTVGLLSGCGGKGTDNAAGQPAPKTAEGTPADTAVNTDAAAAAEENGEKVTIKILSHWQEGANAESDIALKLFDQFMTDNPDIVIENEAIMGDEIRDVVAVRIAAGEAPDIWQFGCRGSLVDFYNSGILGDLSSYFENSDLVKLENYSDATIEGVSVDGVVCAVPKYKAVGVFMCNSELFEKYGLKYPTTWEEFLECGKVFRQNGITPTNIGSKGGNPSHFWHSELINQYEAGVTDIRNMSKELNFSTEAFQKAAKYIEEMRDAGMFSDDVTATGDWDPSMAYYNEGLSAMCYTFGWEFENISDEMVEKSVIIPIPKLPDAERDPAAFMQGTVNECYAVNQKSMQDKQEAMTKVLDLISHDLILECAKQGLLVSVDSSIQSQVDPSQFKTPLLVKALEYHEKQQTEASPMVWQNLPAASLQADYQSYLDELWSGAIDAEEFTAKCQAMCDELK